MSRMEGGRRPARMGPHSRRSRSAAAFRGQSLSAPRRFHVRGLDMVRRLRNRALKGNECCHAHWTPRSVQIAALSVKKGGRKLMGKRLFLPAINKTLHLDCSFSCGRFISEDYFILSTILLYCLRPTLASGCGENHFSTPSPSMPPSLSATCFGT